MLASTFTYGRLFVGRVAYDDDLVQSVEKFCEANGINMGLFSAIGSVRDATVGYYKQTEKVYLTLPMAEPREIISCNGNVSTRDGKPFLHAHISLADADGNTCSGHLMAGTIVFACEFTIQEIFGPQLLRDYDEVTGLWLWQKF